MPSGYNILNSCFIIIYGFMMSDMKNCLVHVYVEVRVEARVEE